MAQAQLDQVRTSPSEHTGLQISVRTGAGWGHTLLSSFDNALQQAGVADFNLVTLSSVIPTGSQIRTVNGALPGGHGDLLFCVRSQAFAEHPGDFAVAGLGWCVDETGGGLFVEHHGGSEESVVEQIELSLADMNATRGGGYGPVQIALAEAHCTGLPACALVVAAYRVSSWHDTDTERRPEVPAEAPRSFNTDQGLNGAGTLSTDPRISASGTNHPEPATEDAPASAVQSVPHVPDIRVTVEKEVDFATARQYYDLYRDTFGELETMAVARQLLHESEFLEEMMDGRVDKYVAWDEAGQAIGMTTFTSDLSTVPWISPGYFAHHYPEHHARGAIYYLGFTLVHPDHRGAHVFHAMIEPMARLATSQKAVVAWDMCMANDERGLGGSAGRLLRSLADITIVQIDQQTYYAGTFHGPRQDAASQ